MSNRHATTAPEGRPRTLVAGKTEHLNDGRTLYVLTLDGGEIVETSDVELARAARKAKDEGRSFTADIEYKNGHPPRLVELVVGPLATTTTAPAPAAPVAAAPLALVETPQVPEGLITTPHDLRDTLQRFRDHYIVLSPAIQISQLAEGYGANLSVIPIDTTVNQEGAGSDTYFNSKIMKPGERALSKIGLLRIAQALGIMWSPDHCRRLDDGRTRNLWRWGYYGIYRTHDGSMAPVMGSAELDLREGSDEIKGWTDGQVKAQRSKGNEICETKAMLRAIRSIGIRQKYSVDELKKPFLAVRFTFTPDMSDPEIKKLVTEQAMRGSTMLFGSTPPPALAAPDFSAGDDDDPTDPTPEPAKTSTPAPDPFAAPEPALPAGATFVEKLDTKTGTAKSGPNKGRPWTLITATFSTGQLASTFDTEIAAKLETARANHWPVRVTTIPNENPAYDDRIDALTVLDQRQPTLPGTEAL